MKPMTTDILFDLDGTLTESDEGILNCVEYALENLEKDIPARDVLRAFLGPPVQDSFRQVCGLTREEAQLALAYYRERFEKTGIYENRLYPGIPGLLRNLKTAGRRIHLATSKPIVYADAILRHFGIAEYFSTTLGPDLSEQGHTKGQLIAEILTGQSIPTQNVLMVGDRRYDMEGARENGVFPVGVLYGYGGREELEAAGAGYIVADVPELASYLLPGPQ